jgi:hypothetical protein
MRARRAGRFVVGDGTLLPMPESVREALAKAGADVTAQPTFEADADFATSSLAELSPDDGLRVIMYELSSAGWWVSHVYIEAVVPLQVRIAAKVEDNAPGIEATVLQAVGRARTRGLPIELLRLEILDGGLPHLGEYDAQALDALQE